MEKSLNESSLEGSTPFDQYSRQFQVAVMVDTLRQKGQSFTVLDVGGYKGRTADFLPKDKVTILDVFDVDEPDYVKGDGASLPFKDGAFDIVMSFDVLEHIPKPKRQAFLDECTRVASRAVFVCAPHKTEANEQAEKMLNDLYKRLHGEEHQWLREHIAFGLPDFEATEKRLQKNGLHTVSFPSNDTMLWVMMQSAIFMNSKFPMNSPEVVKINTFYNRHFRYDGGQNLEETYRIILCGTTSADDNQTITKRFSEKNRPPTLIERLKLSDKHNDYYATLLDKMAHHADNLNALHKHEAKRAEELHQNSLKLWETINDLQGQLDSSKQSFPKKLKDKVKRMRRNGHEKTGK